MKRKVMKLDIFEVHFIESEFKAQKSHEKYFSIQKN
jgi:hypothetical protein